MHPSEDPTELDHLDEEADEWGLPRWRRPVARVTVQTPELELSGIAWDDGSPQVVLLHGVALNAHTWDATVMALGRPALALDLPGHGRSAWREDADYRPATNAGPVAVAVERLAPQAPLVVGQSLGGLTAIAVAAAHPALVRRLVLVDITPGVVAGPGNPVREFLAGADSFASRDEIVERAASYGLGGSRTALERGVRLNTRKRDDGRVVFTHHFGSLGGLEPVADRDFGSLWPALEGIGVPVLLVRASRGFLTDALVDELLARVPGSSAVTVDGGHNLQEDAPAVLAQVVADFAGTTEI